MAATNYCNDPLMGTAFKLDESGTPVDCTANNLTATVNGALTHAGGIFSNSFVFPGNGNNNIGIGTGVPINTLSTISFGAWIKPTTLNPSAGLFCTGSSILYKANGSRGPVICMSTAGQLTCRMGWSGGEFSWAASKPNLVKPSKTWQHVACTYSFSNVNNQAVLYYNGEVVPTNSQSASGSQSSDSTFKLMIGTETGGNVGGFNGPIDEVFYYNGILTQTQIREIMNCGLDGSLCPSLKVNAGLNVNAKMQM